MPTPYVCSTNPDSRSSTRPKTAHLHQTHPLAQPSRNTVPHGRPQLRTVVRAYPQAWDGMQYGYRVNGPWDPDHGVSFNPYKLLLDPYAKGIEGSMELDPGAFSYECEIVNGKVKGSPFGPMSTIDSVGRMPVSVAIDDRAIDKHAGEPRTHTFRGAKRLSTSCMSKASPPTRHGCPKNFAAPTQASHTRPRSHTCRIWASPPSNCYRSKPNNRNSSCRKEDAPTTGDTPHSDISPRSLICHQTLTRSRRGRSTARGHRHGARIARGRL